MKMKIFPFSGKAVWQNNKPFIWFLLGLLLIYSVLKIIFYNYNYAALFTGAEPGNTGLDKIKLIKWSLAADKLTILGINTFLLLFLQFGRLLSQKISSWVILPAFVLINSFAVLLNLVDIFYFRFHFQRANADLLYVLDHPLKQLFHYNFLIIAAFVAMFAGLIFLIWKLHKIFFASFSKENHCDLLTGIFILCIVLMVIYRNSLTKYLVPTYPLVEIKSKQLPFVQNSFHTFIYSVFRKGSEVKQKNYFPAAECDSVFRIKKLLHISNRIP